MWLLLPAAHHWGTPNMLRLSLMTSVLSVDDWFCCQLKGEWDYPMDALRVVIANPERRPGNFVLFLRGRFQGKLFASTF